MRLPLNKEGLLETRDAEIVEATPPPRRRWSPRSDDILSHRKWSPSQWSPSRLSPASRQRYDALHDRDNSGSRPEPSTFKSNSAPTTPQTTDCDAPDLPSPSARSRFTFSPSLRTKSLSPPSSTKNKTSLISHPQRDTHIPQFELHTSRLGTEAILPGYPRPREHRTEEEVEEDDFDILIKERHDSVHKKEPRAFPEVLSLPPMPSSNVGTATPQSMKSASVIRATPCLRLHELCAMMTSVDDLSRARTFLKAHPDAASDLDQNGGTPLHILSSNKMLASVIGVCDDSDHETTEFLRNEKQPGTELEGERMEKQVLRFMVGELLPLYPVAFMINDAQNQIPFEMVLSEWVNESHEQVISNNPATIFSYAGVMSNVWESTTKIARKTSTALSSGFSMMGESPTSKHVNNMERGDSRSAIFSPEKRQNSAGAPRLPSEDQREASFPENVQLTPRARYAFKMLSVCFDQLERYQTSKLSRQSRAQDPDGLKDFQQHYGSLNIVGAAAQTLASIPGIMMTILLIDNDADRAYALSTSLARRIMLSKSSVGPWLTKMLQSRDRILAQRAVDYLKLLSDELTSSESSFGNHAGPTLPIRRLSTPSQEPPQHQLVIDEVSRLPDFVPSLLGLNERGIEDASTTYIVKQVLGRMISRPFAVTVILCDALFLAILIVGFRYAINKMIEGASVKTVLRWIYVANTGIFYFIIREIGKTVSFILISTRVRRYFLSFWNLIDGMAVILALASTIAMRSSFTVMEKGLDDNTYLRILLAVATGFLWLRVLSFLKALNVQLATFVLAIIQIAKDIVWFCVILATLVVSFSQMFFTLLAPASCGTDEVDDIKCKSTEYLLQGYSVLLGDFGNFERKHFSVFLLVVYSFLATVVLLNVLIAVASDSYEKCLLRSQHLFGRARVMLIAELVSFQNLLQTTGRQPPRTKSGLYSRWRSSGRWIQNWSRASILFFSLSIFVMGAWTVAELVGYSKGEQSATLFSLASVLVNVGLFVVIMVFLASAKTVSDGKESLVSKEDGTVLRVMRRLLGASSHRLGSHYDENKGEWNGRIDYLESHMRRIATEQMAVVNRQAKSLENLVNQTEMRLKTELTVLEDHFSALRDVLLSEVTRTQKTNEFVTMSVQELKNMMSAASSTESRPPVPGEVKVDHTNFRALKKTERRDK